MSVALISSPAEFSAAFAPIVYKFQRKDFEWNSIDNNGGFARLNFLGVDLQTDFTVGDTVYIKSSSGAYDEFGVVTNVAFGGGNTTVTTDIVYHATGDGGTSDDFVNNNSGRALYRVAVMLYDADTDERLLNTYLNYSPDNKGLIYVDVQVVKSLMSPQISGIVSPYGTSQEDESKMIQWYIDVTEQWLLSSESPTLISNVRKALYGTFTVIGTNDYNTRLFKKILSVINTALRLTVGKYFDLSYFGVYPTGVSIDGYGIFVERYLNNELIGYDVYDPTENLSRISLRRTGIEDKIIVRVVTNENTMILDGTDWANIAGPLTFTKGTSTLTRNALAPTDFVGAYQVMKVPNDLIYVFKFPMTVEVTGSWTGEIDIINIMFESNNGDLGQQFYARFDTIIANGTYNLEFKTNINPAIYPNAFAESIGIRVSAIGMLSGTANVVITIPNDDIVSRESNTIIGSQEIEVVEPCKNPVTLGWCNKLGGMDWWTFEFTQEHSYSYSEDRKVRRITLFANDLSFDQWKMVNGLNTIGEVYNRTISELTSDIHGTQRRINSQVYLLRDDMELLDVIVIPIESTTQTKRLKHSIQIQIELPDDYEEDDFFGLDY